MKITSERQEKHKRKDGTDVEARKGEVWRLDSYEQNAVFVFMYSDNGTEFWFDPEKTKVISIEPQIGKKISDDLDDYYSDKATFRGMY